MHFRRDSMNVRNQNSIVRKRRKRSEVSAWRALRRCVFFFGTVSVIPVLLVLLVTTEHYMRPHRGRSFLRPQFVRNDKDDDMRWRIQNMSAVGARFERRRHHLKKVCKNLGLNKEGNDSLHKPNPWEYLINHKHKLVWCNVFKAASTSWMYNFNILAGYSSRFLKKSKLIPLNLARQKYPRPSLITLRKSLNTSTSFMIVRHPLERLLSAYRDKLQFALPHTHHRKLGKEIINKFRKKEDSSLGWQGGGQNRPSFSEFVQYLVDRQKTGEPLDMHWTPMTQFCTPCLLDVQLILHTETLHEDQYYMIGKAGLSSIIEPQWRNAGKSGQTASHLARYYSQLTRAQILQLYHIYRYDFELFNYSLSGYLELGRPDDDPSVLLAAITMGDPNENAPRVY